MKMTLLQMEIVNVRRFPKLTIDFTDDSNNLIKHTFVMMRNGTGKTTIITLIKALLDGSAENWSPDVVKSFKPLGGDAAEGSLKLSTAFDDKRYTYILKLDYQNGIAKTFTTSAAHGGLGERRFPVALNDLFTPDFVNRFVFDGEQAEKTLDNNSNEAEEAIKYLYRLDVFDEILNTNELILKEIQDAQGGAKGTVQQLKNLRTRRDKIKTRVAQLKAELADINRQIDEKGEKQRDLQDKIDQLNRKFSKLDAEKTAAKEEESNCRAAIDLLINDILTNLKSPYLVSSELSSRMNELGASMTKLKLPKSTSKDFFIELSNQKYCVCGREITSVEKDVIRKRADLYLGNDQQSVLNDVKSSMINNGYDDTLEKLFKDLTGATGDLKAVQSRLLAIEAKLLEAGGKQAEELQANKEEIAREIGKLESQRDTIESTDESDPSLTEDNNLHLANAAVRELDEKIATATTSNEALYRRNVIKDIIERIKAEATEKLKGEIIKKTNEKIESVITDDIIRIESIDNYIQLAGKDGASAGQTLSVAYCFLGTLFEDSELLFPFIIDSPCGSMDFDKRAAVASILPTLFNQIVSFVMSAEVQRFADQFYSDKEAQFITVVANSEDNTLEIHRDKDFFDNYQREVKEEE